MGLAGRESVSLDVHEQNTMGSSSLDYSVLGVVDMYRTPPLARPQQEAKVESERDGGGRLVQRNGRGIDLSIDPRRASCCGELG